MMKKISIILVMLFWWGNAFALPECEGDYTKWTNCQGTIEAEGIKYVGELYKGEPHGQGTYTSPDGYKYVGEWKKGKMHGYGIQTNPNGNKYDGEFKNHKYHGQGTFTFPDGRKYVGGWKKSKYHGMGTLTTEDGAIYVGRHKNGEVVEVISRDTSARDKAKKKLELASMVEDAKKTCKDLGFTEGTDKFSDCSLKLYTLSVESAAKNNQTVVMQPQSSGSNSVTIYDPVRDSNALINKGMRMLSGACTAGVNC